MPTNIVIARPAIVSIVPAAFFDSGGLNAGTPFDTASTPVIAVQPLANAVRSRNRVSGSMGDGTGSAVTTGWMPPVIARQPPTVIRTRAERMKKYVGTANICPDSRTPRRLPIVRISTKPSVISTRLTCQAGNADVIAATPAAILTATVST